MKKCTIVSHICLTNCINYDGDLPEAEAVSVQCIKTFRFNTSFTSRVQCHLISLLHQPSTDGKVAINWNEVRKLSNHHHPSLFKTKVHRKIK